jgi:protein-S-isoprenylcysteine O-methyltransferase Ste14
VRNRFYAHVRNPMYIGMGIAVFGEALVFPVQRVAMLWMLLGMFFAINIFILGYEEPTLTRLFGADYEAYKRNVPRWIPRLTPYRPAARTTHA